MIYRFFSTVILMVVGFVAGQWAKDEIVEKCSAGYTFSLNQKQFHCHSTTTASHN